jgi:hypothetical protein
LLEWRQGRIVLGQETSTPAEWTEEVREAAERPAWALLTVILVAAFCFRFLLAYRFAFYGGDAAGYTTLATNLASLHGYSVAHTAPYVASDIRVPAYPALLAVAFAINTSHWSVIILNALLGTLSTLLIWPLSRGLGLTQKRALWATGMAALFFSTASIADSALSENLSIPAVLALVTFVLVRPPHSRLALFAGGSMLAWVVALTRDELVAFVVLVAIVAGRRAHLRAVGSVALVLCFLVGSGAWVVRNEIQVHRTEYVDSVMTEQVFMATLDGTIKNPLYIKAEHLIDEPQIAPAERTAYGHQVNAYVKNDVEHHFPSFVRNKAHYLIASIIPVPIYSLTNRLGWLIWSLFLVVEYVFATLTGVRWWRAGRKADVVSIAVFPVFILCCELIFAPLSRYWLPATLLLIPPAIEGVATAFANRSRAAFAKQPDPVRDDSPGETRAI